MEQLIKAGADVDADDEDGDTPLICATRRIKLDEHSKRRGSYKAHVDAVRLLVQHEADVNKTNNGGASPLHVAVSLGDPRHGNVGKAVTVYTGRPRKGYGGLYGHG
jgi:ankyrin repeat protein